MGYQISDFPDEIKAGKQNISIKISPVLDLELITNFNPGKSFEKAYQECIKVEMEGYSYSVLSFNDLIMSKIYTNRAKDKTDIEELYKIQLRKND